MALGKHHSDVEGLLAKVAGLRPLIEQHIETSEHERRLATPIFEGLRDAGLFQLMVPKALGGFELDPVSAYCVVEELSRIDGATGWCVGISQAWGGIGLSLMGDTALAEVFPNPGTVVAGAFVPTAMLTPVMGGYRMSNRAAFASGCQHANVHMMTGVVADENGPVMNPETGVPDTHVVMIPRAEVTIHDTWDTLGMRGTGSHDIEVRDIFVPGHHVGTFGVVKSAAYANPMYRIFMIGPQLEAVTSVGVAQGAIDSLIGLAANKVPALSASSLRDRASAQSQVGEAQAIVNAARASLHASAIAAVEEFTANGVLSMQAKLEMQLAANFAADGGARAVQLVWAAAGTSGVRAGSALHRQFRDINTLSQHASKSLQRYESVGQVMFGLESDWPIFNF